MADLEKYWTGFCFVAQAHSEWFCPTKQSHRVADSAVHRCRFRLMYAMLITIYLKLSSLPASWGGNSQSSLHCLPISSLSKACALVLHSINSRNILPRGLLKKCYGFFFFFLFSARAAWWVSTVCGHSPFQSNQFSCPHSFSPLAVRRCVIADVGVRSTRS